MDTNEDTNTTPVPPEYQTKVALMALFEQNWKAFSVLCRRSGAKAINEILARGDKK